MNESCLHDAKNTYHGNIIVSLVCYSVHDHITDHPDAEEQFYEPLGYLVGIAASAIKVIRKRHCCVPESDGSCEL